MSDQIAGENLAVLATYFKDTYKDLTKHCTAGTTSEKEIRKNMIAWMKKNGFAKEPAPGHGSSKPGKSKGMQEGTKKFGQAVAKALK